MRETLPITGEVGNRRAETQAPVPPATCQKRCSHKCASPSATADDEEPAAKKQSVEQSDVPLSLVVPKVKEWILLSLRFPLSEERLFPKTVFSEVTIHYTALVKDTNAA